MKKQKLEKKTREIFHKIHITQGENPKIFDRLQSLLNTDYLRVKEDFFIRKICLDAGCGSNANATLAMLKMGAEKVYAFDLDDSIFEKVPRYLREFKGKYELRCGNVLNIAFPDNFFDFTHCAGVLHHTVDAFRGIKELARVTKKGGVLYISINGSGGLVREITNFLRDKYTIDVKFRRLIDNLSEKHLRELWIWVTSQMSMQNDNIGKKIPLTLIQELFNNDLILTIKDRITAPLYHEFTEKQIVKLLMTNGFINVERLSRYPKIRNIRRFLCPFYYSHAHKFSRVLYGDGVIQLKAIKAR